MSFFGGQEGEEYDPIAQAPGPSSEDPTEVLARNDAMDALEQALRDLPRRQREAFMLRNFEGLERVWPSSAATLRSKSSFVRSSKSRSFFTFSPSIRHALQASPEAGARPGSSVF